MVRPTWIRNWAHRSAVPLAAAFTMAAGGQGAVHADQPGPTPVDPDDKRVIIFAGQHLGPDFFGRHRERLEQLPVTGIVLTLWVRRDGKAVYLPDDFSRGTRYGPGTFREDITKLKAVKGLMPDTLLRLNIGHRIDWYDDAVWEVVTDNARLLSEVVAQGSLRGYCLDTEQYVTKPYAYPLQEHAGKRTFAEYQAQVRKRGGQLLRAMTAAKPDVTVMFTFGHSAAARHVTGGLPLARAGFGLLPALIDGMMECGPSVEFVDGYEHAYPFKAHRAFVDGARCIREEGRKVSLRPDLYSRRMKVGFGIWPIGGKIVNDEPFSFTPIDLEHALHYALRESDGLVWLYMGGLRPWPERFPEEYVRAIANAWKPHPLDHQENKQEASVGPYVARARGRPEVKDEVAFSHLAGKYREVLDLPLEWRFRMDPDDVGRKQAWFAEEHNDSAWDKVEIREWWQPQGFMYCGHAWYRITVDVPRADTTAGWILAFGAVDEQAWVWMNGRKAGEHAFGPQGWQSPFEMDVSRLLRPGQENQITVRVHDSVGVGGIWKGVKLMAPTPAR